MVALPRHVIPKRLAGGQTAFYYNLPTAYRKLHCPISNEPLGSDFAKMQARAQVLNGQFDEWDRTRKGLPITGASNVPKYSSVDWLFREYMRSDAYLQKVAVRSRSDYEWAVHQICDLRTKSGGRVGERLVKAVDPRAADKLYNRLIASDDGKERLRTGEKLVGLCRKAWRVVHRLFPKEFDREVPNPWTGVTLKVRAKNTKAAVVREEVYAFAHGAIAAGYPEAAAIAVICFEWLQRPENVVSGHMKWSDYRSPSEPSIIRVEHHKTGTVAPHPLEEVTGDGVILFYADAEEVLSKLPKRGPQMILRDAGDGVSKPWRYSSLNHVVKRLRGKIEGVPDHFTFDACRHGGLTELEEAELTDGQGRALSTHKTQKAYEGYAKRTSKRMLSATRKRHAHLLAGKRAENEAATAVQNDASDSVQNAKPRFGKSA